MGWIKFMTNDKSLISFSLISTTFEQKNKDSIDMLIPFVLYYFDESDVVEKDSIISISDTKQYLQNEFGLKILSNIIEIIFDRLTTKEYNVLKKINKYFRFIDIKTNISEFKSCRKQNQIEQSFVIKEFYKFLDNKKIEYDKEIANNSLISYLCNYGKNVIAENNLIVSTNNYWDFKVGEFIQYVYESKDKIFEYIKNIAKGGMISSIIFTNAYIQSSNKHFKNTVIYYDTMLLMHILGYSGTALQESIVELTSLLQKQGATICYFRHNLLELKGILNAYVKLYKSNNLNKSFNFDYLISQKIKPETISEYLVLLEKNLSKSGLILKDTPDFSNIQNNIDWDKFNNYLKDNISYQNPNRRDNDVASLAAIYRLRDKKYYDQYENCQALFVSANKSLVYHTRSYFKYDEKKNGIPAIVDDTFLTAYVWLKTGNKDEQLPTLRIIADALSSQTLSSNFWDTFLQKVDNFEKENIITEEEAINLKFDIYTKRNVYDVTDGDIDKIDHGKLQELLQRNEMQKHKEILQEKDDLKKNLETKDDTIELLSSKVIESKAKLFLSHKFTKWNFYFLLGKLWILILCIFLVTLSKVFDFILLKNNNIFISGSILSVIISISSKFIDKKLSSKNKGIENVLYGKSFKLLSDAIILSEKEFSNEIIQYIKNNVKQFNQF